MRVSWPATRKRQQLQDLEEARLAAQRAEDLAEARRQVAAEREAERQAQFAGRDWLSLVRSALFRGRYVLRPLVALAVLHCVGAIVSRESVSLLLSLVLSLGAALALWGARYRRLSRDTERRYAAVLLAAAVLWLDWTNLSDIAVTDFALWFVGALASIPFWSHHWPREAPALPEPVTPDTIAERWEANLAAPGRQLAGAHMTGEVDATEHYDAYTVELVPGVHSYAEAMGKLPKIETGLRTPLSRLHLEHPHPEYQEDPAMVQLRVIRESPGREVQWLRQPVFRDGMIGLGDHTDHDGQAWWRVFTENRMWGGFLAGGTGIGKTRLAEVMAVTMRQQFVEAALPTAIVYLDGQNGASSPLLYKHSTWPGGLADAEAVLSGLERAVEVRQAINRSCGLTGFTPGLVLPKYGALTALLVLVDECHKIWDTKPRAKRWAGIAREAGKLGIAVVGLSQATDIDVFGNYETLRSSLLAGNGVAMRIASKTDGSLIPNLPLNPADLPQIPGFGITIAAPQSGLRTAPFRAPFSPAETDLRQGVKVPAGVPLLDELFERTAEAPVDPYTAAGLGQAFLDREKTAELAQAATDEFLERIRRGELHETGRERIVVQMAPAAGKKTTVGETCLAMCEAASGPVQKKDMVERTGATPQAVGLALTKLIEEKRLVRLPGLAGKYTTPERAAGLAETAG